MKPLQTTHKETLITCLLTQKIINEKKCIDKVYF